LAQDPPVGLGVISDDKLKKLHYNSQLLGYW
jgi:hypothetical protein